jgi:hypothetical protein
MRKHRLPAVVALIVLLALTPAAAQAPSSGPEPERVSARTFGPAAETVLTLQAFAFAGADLTTSPLFSRFCFVSCSFFAPVVLPAGALVSRIELAACDNDGAGAVSATLWRIENPEVGKTALASAASPVPGTPGCATFTDTLATPETIDNAKNSYLLEVFVAGSGNNTRFQAVRVFHRLQVSVAPPTATFGDVPTSHPFYQYVEALVASGITVGCGGGDYCPDASLTRGQMAVFLSKALGLHFAP